MRDEFVEIQNELTFESDMRVTVQNKEKAGIFSKGEFCNKIIGEFVVPVQSIMTRSKNQKP